MLAPGFDKEEVCMALKKNNVSGFAASILIPFLVTVHPESDTILNM